MNTKYNASLRSTLALGALLLLTAGLTGCGVGLPTAPEIQSAEPATVSNGRTAGAVSGEFNPNGEIVDNDDATSGGGGDTGEIQPYGELPVQTPTSHPGVNGQGYAWGHYKDKWKNR
jgi:hypothetical protein